ncbi:MAG TPA: universal stress protein [Bacteroidia bacterium]|jgi:nucleotide-binding universal stress UspA family protein
MKGFNVKRILVPIDFSETSLLALEHAGFMAKLFKADLYLTHVIEISEYTYSIYDPAVKFLDLDEIRKIVIEKLDELAKRTRKEYGVHVNTICTNGRIPRDIVDTSKENAIDLIVMGTHGASGSEEFFIGSNAHRTVTLSACPVITVQTHAKKTGFRNILLPIDNTLHSRQKVDYAIEIAKHYHSKIHVLGLPESNADEDMKKFMIKLEAVEHAIKKAGLTYSIETIFSKNIAREAMDYAPKVNADLTVIMTDHESNLTGMFLGVRAKQVVNHSKVPVLSIKPVEGEYDSIDLSAASPF